MNISDIISLVAAVVASVGLFHTVFTQKAIQKKKIKRSTVEAFNKLQNEVLDKLAPLDSKNANVIAENRKNNEEFWQAYVDYKTLISRLEHFSVGVKEKVYDLDVLDELAGEHLIFLLPKIKPIIDAANERCDVPKYYQNYISLVENLKSKHRSCIADRKGIL